MRSFAVALWCFVAISGVEPAMSQVAAAITDGKGSFSEGVLTGYIVQANGKTICKNPVVWGKYIACSGRAKKRVWVDTNGVLGAYVVVDRNGKAVCTNPMASNQFRGPDSYIYCQ